VDDLDEDGAGDAICAHEREEGLDGGVFRGWVDARGEGEVGGVLPDVDVAVDEEGGGGLGESAERGECGGGRGEEEGAAVHGVGLYGELGE
jgi:hypothetical protein